MSPNSYDTGKNWPRQDGLQIEGTGHDEQEFDLR